jgi:hypothetical protein
MPQLIIKIVDRGTNHKNQKTGETKPSQTGHMWFELIDYNGNILLMVLLQHLVMKESHLLQDVSMITTTPPTTSTNPKAIIKDLLR